MREVVFSACLSHETAQESQGHGDFTRYALQVLAQGSTGLSNGDFAERITQAFGPMPQQHALLYSSDAGRALALLQPLAMQPPRYTQGAAASASTVDENGHVDLAEVRAQLARISELLAHLH